jgi:hypothetical protein
MFVVAGTSNNPATAIEPGQRSLTTLTGLTFK